MREAYVIREFTYEFSVLFLNFFVLRTVFLDILTLLCFSDLCDCVSPLMGILFNVSPGLTLHSPHGPH